MEGGGGGWFLRWRGFVRVSLGAGKVSVGFVWVERAWVGELAWVLWARRERGGLPNIPSVHQGTPSRAGVVPWAWRGRGRLSHDAAAHHGTTVTLTVQKRGKNAWNCRGLDPQASPGDIRHSATESPSAFRLARTRNKNGSGASQSLVYYRFSDGGKC